MLEVERFLLCPLLCPLMLPSVFALERGPGGLTRSVLICLWKRVPVAASDSAGISSFTWTVCACCRRLSSREKRREQWHWKGRSPVCFLSLVSSALAPNPAQTYRMCLAKCSLLVKLRLQGGKSVQKKRCPFFFFDGLPLSLFTLSLSDPSLSSSSSPSPICTSSAASADCVDVCDCPLLRLLLMEGVSLSSREGVNGDDGRGRCPVMPMKLLRVGVLREASSLRVSSPLFESLTNVVPGRGVVGVVSSPERPAGGSGTARVVLTAWKLDMLGWFRACRM